MTATGNEGHDSEARSKFEWRPEDITILTPGEAAAAEAEYQEILTEMSAAAAQNPGEERIGDAELGANG